MKAQRQRDCEMTCPRSAGKANSYSGLLNTRLHPAPLPSTASPTVPRRAALRHCVLFPLVDKRLHEGRVYFSVFFLRGRAWPGITMIIVLV